MAVKPASCYLMAAQKWPVIAPSFQCEVSNLTQTEVHFVLGHSGVFPIILAIDWWK